MQKWYAMASLVLVCLATSTLSSCAPSYRSTRPPKTLSEAQHRAAQREVRRYYNPTKRRQLLGHE